jgi:hypothetical protein
MAKITLILFVLFSLLATFMQYETESMSDPRTLPIMAETAGVVLTAMMFLLLTLALRNASHALSWKQAAVISFVLFVLIVTVLLGLHSLPPGDAYV